MLLTHRAGNACWRHYEFSAMGAGGRQRRQVKSTRVSEIPVFLTLPTALSTGHISNPASGHGLSSANNSSSVAGSSPSQFGQSLAAQCAIRVRFRG